MKAREIKLLYGPGPSPSIRITRSQDAYDLLMQDWNKSAIRLYEEFKAVLLDQAGNVLGVHPLAKGGMTGCVVDVRLLLASCLLAKATRLIIAHNHPSGSTRPSQQDIRLTNKIKQAARLMDVELLDHIVLAEESYLSFLDEGML